LSLKKNILLGSGGHASVLFEVLSLLDEKPRGMVDKQPKRFFENCSYWGDDVYLDGLEPSHFKLVNGIGRNGRQNRRAEIFQNFKAKGFDFLSVIHPAVILARDVSLDEGVQLMAGVMIQPNVQIQKNVIVNTGALIEHDSYIAEHVFIGPRATICGEVCIAAHAFIGAGAVILPGVKIGKNAVIGAGAVVLEDIPDYHLAVGNPAGLKGVYSHDELEKCPGSI
jgi:sugar O-acyltransferase (sialic acid O-acetyltransferase NeuD family)